MVKQKKQAKRITLFSKSKYKDIYSTRFK